MTVRDDLKDVFVDVLDPDPLGNDIRGAAADAVLEFFGNLDPDAPTELIADHLRHDLSDTRRLLVHALTGDRERRDLYARSAMFKTSIDTLAAMLPAWIDGLAENAERHEIAMVLAADAVERGTAPFPGPPFPSPGL